MNGPGKYGWCDDSDHGWGPVVVIKHTSDNGFKVSDNAIIALGNCGTDRNPKVIYSLYGHLSKDSIKDISIGQTLNTGDLIGVIGKYGVDQASWTTNHLHFEIKDEVGFLEGGWYISHPGQCPGTAAQSCGAQGIGTGYSHLANFAPHRYIPSVFIIENQGRKAHIPGVINLLMSD
jgi:murein DD-endopeptidase MepM/ murein hydrolase activator NlpD